MPREQVISDNVGKTGTLVALANLILAPTFWVDARLGVSVAIAATVGLLFASHEVGKNRRPMANAVNRGTSFFGPITGDKSTEVRNALDNIAVGGAAIFDEIIPDSTMKKTR